MPLTPDEFYAHAMTAADAERRLPLGRITSWLDVFPFEAEGLRVVPLQPPQLPEPPREGVDGTDCWGCARRDDVVWSDEHWRLRAMPGSGAPLILVLEPLAHHDLPTLPDPRAAELGRLQVHLARAVESLPHIARAHVMRIGDGGEHLHVFVFARPEGQLQLRGSNFLLWDDMLPETPAALIEADARTVAQALAASYGGNAS